MKARHRPRRHHGQVAGEVHAIAPDLLDRQLEASEPDQQWAAEFTYVWTGEGLPFVAMVFRPLLAPCGQVVDANEHGLAASYGRAVDGSFGVAGQRKCYVTPIKVSCQ